MPNPEAFHTKLEPNVPLKIQSNQKKVELDSLKFPR